MTSLQLLKHSPSCLLYIHSPNFPSFNSVIFNDIIILPIVLINLQFNMHLKLEKNCGEIKVIIPICLGTLVQNDSSIQQLSTLLIFGSRAIQASSNYKSPNIDSLAKFATYGAVLKLQATRPI